MLYPSMLSNLFTYFSKLYSCLFCRLKQELLLLQKRPCNDDHYNETQDKMFAFTLFTMNTEI